MPRPKKHKIRHIVRRAYEAPWAILPSKLAEIAELLDLRASGEGFTDEEIAARIGPPRTDQLVARLHANEPHVSGGGGGGGQVAMLNLFGVVAQRMNAMESVSGGTSIEQFGKAFDAAVADEDVSTIVINADSPGGSVSLVPELAAKIYAAREQKRIITVVNPLMASASLWIGSAAHEVVATPSARVGSQGVMFLHHDETAADEQAGIKTTIFTSAKYKAEAMLPLTDAAREHFQATVDTMHAKLVADVAKHRGLSVAKVESDFGEGRMFLAEEALAAGMIDRVATLEEILSELGVGAGSSANTNSNSRQRKPAFQSKVSKEAMDPKILTALVKRGLCTVETDEAVAVAALNGFFAARNETVPEDADKVVAALAATKPPAAAKPATATEPGQAAATVQPVATAQPAATVQPAAINPAVPAMAAEQLLTTIRLSPLGAEAVLELHAELVPQLATLSHEQILKRINEAAVAATPTVGAARIEAGAAGVDTFAAEARDAILDYAWGHDRPEEVYDFRSREMVAFKPKPVANRFLQSPMRLAEECLAQAGMPKQQLQRLSKGDIAKLICGSHPSNLGIFAASDGPAFNVSGMFSSILLDASNVLLRRSYEEANTTFQVWMRQAPSIADYRDVHKVIAGELSDPKVVPEDGEFEETTMTDGKEKYHLHVWGHIFSITHQAMVNDAMGAFTEIQPKQGTAMRRKQNKLAYNLLKDNNALQNDGVALFDSSSHSNVTTGANPPSVATLNTMYQKMAEQSGLDSTTTLNIEPQYIIIPPALRGTVLELLGSTGNPAASNGNSAIINIWQNGLQPVIDAQLGAGAGGSDVKYYLAASPSVIDTIEYAYLQGLESPAVERIDSFMSLAMKFRIYQPFAVKAIDFRGLQRHNGA